MNRPAPRQPSRKKAALSITILVVLTGIVFWIFKSHWAEISSALAQLKFWQVAVVLAVGLSMDAFAVSICKGLALQRVSWKECCIAGAWFGGFQALMPLLGYLLGTQFEQFVTSVDHWIAFVLLGIIGGNMIREALSKDEDKLDGSLAFKTMLLLAIATSIDALAVGITFAFLPGTRIVPAVALIGSITFVFSAAGIRLGNVFGLRYKSKAEFAGGVILILLGTKILLEHLGVL